MKKLFMILPLALILCFMVGCQDKAAMAELEELKAQREVEEQNKELVRKWFEAVDNGNWEFIREKSAPEYAEYLPSGIAEPASIEQGIKLTKMFIKGIPDIVHDIKEIIAVGDKVIVRFIGLGTHTGDIEEMGISATGNKIEVSSICIIRIEKGKVVEFRQDADMLGLMQQFGMELKPKEGEK
jgi:predicted ester cyclase